MLKNLLFEAVLLEVTFSIRLLILSKAWVRRRGQQASNTATLLRDLTDSTGNHTYNRGSLRLNLLGSIDMCESRCHLQGEWFWIIH